MGRFERRRRITEGAGESTWIADLPETFTLDDVLSRAGHHDAALGWLYLAVERGRVEPIGRRDGALRYRFSRARRTADAPPSDVEPAAS